MTHKPSPPTDPQPEPPDQIAWLREQADNAERTDPHDHMDVSMALSYAADTIRRAADLVASLQSRLQQTETRLRELGTMGTSTSSRTASTNEASS